MLRIPAISIGTPRALRRAFTLVELMVVVTVAGILAVSAIPALSRLDGARQAGAAHEVARMLEAARDHAALTGEPSGVKADATRSVLGMVRLPPQAPIPSPMLDALGTARAEVRLDSEFPGVTVESIVGFDGLSGSTTLWFGSDGMPEVRDSSGALVSAATADAQVVLSHGQVIVVHAGTGLVE